MKPKQQRIIRCPQCGCEYLPAEIYLPNEFLGKPKRIVKDYLGKILGFDGETMNDKETYKCDKCDTTFEVIATTNFITRPVGAATPHYTTKLQKVSLFLDE